ncbi:MAG TPA: cellulose biosynthesis cyclic di-GMP-binding regulatory protein BcsB, partial [Paraburkholderia sp.]
MRVSFRAAWAALCAWLIVVIPAAVAAPPGAAATAAPAAAPAAVTTVAPAAAPSADASPSTAAAAPAAAGPTHTRVLTLNQMGVYGPIPLRGQDPDGSMSVNVRTDEVVTGAQLKLDYAYSPALIFPLSHLKVLLNGEAVATLPLDHDDAGKEVSRTVDLDPRLFVDFNRITVQMIAHYTTDQCEDPY